MFLIIVCGVLVPLGFAIFCYFYCRRQNGDRVFIFKRPFNLYVTLFLDRISCGLGCGLLRTRCGGCLRDKEEVVGGVKKPVSNSGGGGEGVTASVDTLKSEKKQKRVIEITPGELTSCTNTKLVSSSICLNVDK